MLTKNASNHMDFKTFITINKILWRQKSGMYRIRFYNPAEKWKPSTIFFLIWRDRAWDFLLTSYHNCSSNISTVVNDITEKNSMKISMRDDRELCMKCVKNVQEDLIFLQLFGDCGIENGWRMKLEVLLFTCVGVHGTHGSLKLLWQKRCLELFL